MFGWISSLWNNDEELPEGWTDPNVNYFKEGMPVGTLSVIDPDGTVSFEGSLDNWKPKSFLDNASDAATETIDDLKSNINKKISSAKNTAYTIGAFALVAIYLIKK